MSKINYKQAREMLSQTCEHYIDHNRAQLDAIDDGRQNSNNGPRQTNLGFESRAHYAYENIKMSILWFEKREFMSIYEEYASESGYFEAFKFGQIRGGMLGAPLSNPCVVLHNLTALTRLLHHIMLKGNATPDFNTTLKEYRQQHQRVYPCSEDTPLGWYKLNDKELIGNDSQKSAIYQYRVIDPGALPMQPSQKVGLNATKDVPTNLLLPYMASEKGQPHPLSIQIYNTLKNFKSLFDCIDTLPDKGSKHRCDELGLLINESYPIFEGYIKGIAVKELKATLNDASLSDEDAIKAIELQLKNPTTMEILTKNRQSQSEHILKVLSVVSILIGVGIFSTLGLVFKRLYDSGGTSINFFKPLSKNLFEDAETITANISKGP